jgi:hypothetical protein
MDGTNFHGRCPFTFEVRSEIGRQDNWTREPPGKIGEVSIEDRLVESVNLHNPQLITEQRPLNSRRHRHANDRHPSGYGKRVSLKCDITSTWPRRTVLMLNAAIAKMRVRPDIGRRMLDCGPFDRIEWRWWRRKGRWAKDPQQLPRATDNPVNGDMRSNGKDQQPRAVAMERRNNTAMTEVKKDAGRELCKQKREDDARDQAANRSP